MSTAKSKSSQNKLAILGGNARAAALSPERRSDIARRAAASRWGDAFEESPPPLISDDVETAAVVVLDDAGCSEATVAAAGDGDALPFAEYGSHDRPLRIGDIAIPCYVLNDGRRILGQRGIQVAIGMSDGGGRGGVTRVAHLATRLVEAGALHAKELLDTLSKPIKFRIKAGTGTVPVWGYEATVLADLCDVMLAARRERKLHPQQMKFADQCELLMRGFSRVGITALVDEATGYQDVRTRNALADILERFIAKDLRGWERTFEIDFYRELFRLRGWQFDPLSIRRPMLAAQLTTDIVYSRLAPGVLDKLRDLVKEYRAKKGNKTNPKLFQYLTEKHGLVKLKEHLAVATTLMQLSPTWDQFIDTLDKVRPRYGITLLLPFKKMADSIDDDNKLQE